MKIAFLLRKFPVVSETFILDQITNLIDQGHQVDIYAIYEGEGITHRAYRDYHLHHRTLYPPQVPSNPTRRIVKLIFLLLRNIKYWSALLPTLNVFKYGRQAQSLYLTYLGLFLLNKPHRYDIIHCHFGLMGLIGCDLRTLGFLKGKIVTSFHGMDVNTYPKQHGIGIYRRLFQQGDLFTANSRFTIDKLCVLGCPVERIVKLPVGVNLADFEARESTIKDRQNLKIISVGRLVECKGFEYGIKAVASIKSSYPHLSYSLVGDGPLYPQLQSLIQSLNAASYIKLLGAQTQDLVREMYCESDIFMLPSIVGHDGAEEAQGLVLQEAQAAGLPVLSTLIGGIPDGVMDGESGYLVPQRDSEALANRLNHLLEHPKQRENMGRKGRKFVKEHYNQGALTQKLETLYASLLNND